jgi:hypothetical protein
LVVAHYYPKVQLRDYPNGFQPAQLSRRIVEDKEKMRRSQCDLQSSRRGLAGKEWLHKRIESGLAGSFMILMWGSEFFEVRRCALWNRGQ